MAEKQFSITPPFRVRALTADDGMDIATWRYPGPWSVYDSVDAPRADDGFWAVEDASARLVGFCCFGQEARVPGQPESAGVLDVGLGLRPEVTGQGYGSEFARTVVAYARTVAPDATLRCVVQEWNARSRRVAEAAGFAVCGSHEVGTGSGRVRYLVMEIPASAPSASPVPPSR